MRSGCVAARRTAAAAVVAGWALSGVAGQAAVTVPVAAVGALGSGSVSASAAVAAVGTPGAGRAQRAHCHSRGCGRGSPTPRRTARGTVGSMCRGGTGTVGGILAWCRCLRRCRTGPRACALGQRQCPCRGRCVAAHRAGHSRVFCVDAWRWTVMRAGVGPQSCRRLGRRMSGARARRALRARRARRGGRLPSGRSGTRFMQARR